MTLWLVLAALTLFAVAGLALPLLHHGARVWVPAAAASFVLLGAACLYSILGRPDLHDIANYSALGDTVVRAARGKVTAEALSDFRQALAENPTDPRARFYLALFEDQQGRHAKAIDDWVALVKSSPRGAPWIGPVRAVIERVARENGISVAGRFGRASTR